MRDEECMRDEEGRENGKEKIKEVYLPHCSWFLTAETAFLSLLTTKNVLL